jgi:hypothetical protein
MKNDIVQILLFLSLSVAFMVSAQVKAETTQTPQGKVVAPQNKGKAKDINKQLMEVNDENDVMDYYPG